MSNIASLTYSVLRMCAGSFGSGSDAQRDGVEVQPADDLAATQSGDLSPIVRRTTCEMSRERQNDGSTVTSC